MSDRPDIIPDMKVGELLRSYPKLEEELVAITPAFEKLRNPVLRRTVARITTLRQAASVGGVSLGEIIGRLRVSAGQVADLTGEPSAVTRPHRAFLLPSPSITTTGVGPSLPERGHFHPDVQRLGSGRAAS